MNINGNIGDHSTEQMIKERRWTFDLPCDWSVSKILGSDWLSSGHYACALAAWPGSSQENSSCQLLQLGVATAKYFQTPLILWLIECVKKTLSALLVHSVDSFSFLHIKFSAKVKSTVRVFITFHGDYLTQGSEANEFTLKHFFLSLNFKFYSFQFFSSLWN